MAGAINKHPVLNGDGMRMSAKFIKFLPACEGVRVPRVQRYGTYGLLVGLVVCMLFLSYAIGVAFVWHAVGSDEPPRRQPFLGPAPTAANNPRPTPAAGKTKALPTYLRLDAIIVQDGDSLQAEIELPYGERWPKRKIRVLGFDAFESSNVRAGTVQYVPDELVKGRKAAEDAARVLSEADAVYIETTPDLQTTFNRILGAIWFDPPGDEAELVNYGDWMRGRGHARPSDPELLKQAKEKK
jgi:endonuclease YncB( thermonuclease family)